MKERGLAFFILMFFVLTFTPGAYALSIGFTDKDFLGGASWGTMTIDIFDSNTLSVRYSAAPDSVIPAGSRVSGFGFDFDIKPSAVGNPADDVSTDDLDAIDWVVLNNLSAIPNPANRDELSPTVDKNDYSFGVTEGNARNFSGNDAIEPGQSDVFYLDFTGVDFGLLALEDFVNLTGIRLQSLPNDINGGSLFLAGNGDNGGAPVPEPATVFLLGSGLIGLAAFRRKTKG